MNQMLQDKSRQRIIDTLAAVEEGVISDFSLAAKCAGVTDNEALRRFHTVDIRVAEAGAGTLA